MEEKVREILKKIKGEYFDFDDRFITGGYISSFDLMYLITLLEDCFGTRIPIDELTPEDFDSIEGICAVLKRCSIEEKN